MELVVGAAAEAGAGAGSAVETGISGPTCAADPAAGAEADAGVTGPGVTAETGTSIVPLTVAMAMKVTGMVIVSDRLSCTTIEKARHHCIGSQEPVKAAISSCRQQLSTAVVRHDLGGLLS